MRVNQAFYYSSPVFCPCIWRMLSERCALRRYFCNISITSKFLQPPLVQKCFIEVSPLGDEHFLNAQSHFEYILLDPDVFGTSVTNLDAITVDQFLTTNMFWFQSWFIMSMKVPIMLDVLAIDSTFWWETLYWSIVQWLIWLKTSWRNWTTLLQSPSLGASNHIGQKLHPLLASYQYSSCLTDLKISNHISKKWMMTTSSSQFQEQVSANKWIDYRSSETNLIMWRSVYKMTQVLLSLWVQMLKHKSRSSQKQNLAWIFGWYSCSSFVWTFCGKHGRWKPVYIDS